MFDDTVVGEGTADEEGDATEVVEGVGFTFDETEGAVFTDALLVSNGEGTDPEGAADTKGGA